jgi:hypothetical protein
LYSFILKSIYFHIDIFSIGNQKSCGKISTCLMLEAGDYLLSYNIWSSGNRPIYNAQFSIKIWHLSDSTRPLVTLMSAPNTPFVVILNKTDVTVQSIPKYHKLQLHVQSYGVFFLEFSGCSGSTYLNDVQVIPLAPQTDCVQAGIFYDFSVDDPLPYQHSPWTFRLGPPKFRSYVRCWDDLTT